LDCPTKNNFGFIFGCYSGVESPDGKSLSDVYVLKGYVHGCYMPLYKSCLIGTDSCMFTQPNGPFIGSENDSTIFINTLADLLADDEGVEVDAAGYKGHSKLKAPTVATSRNAWKKQKSQVCGRHENVNSQLKIFNVLNIPFRHNNPQDKMMTMHGWCFNAIAVVTEL
jgi:hypothetical protein